MKLFLAILIALASLAAQAQERTRLVPQKSLRMPDKTNEQPDAGDPAIDSMLASIESALRASSPGSLRSMFADRIAMNIRGLESGTYSVNQAISILEQYFSSRNALSFSFSRKDFSGVQPFATGRLAYNKRGARESAQVYVAFVKQETHWVVSEFNLY